MEKIRGRWPKTAKILFLFLLVTSSIQAAASLAYGACRDVSINFDVYRIQDTPGDTSYPTSPFIPGAYYGTGAPSNAAGVCNGPNEVLVGISQPQFSRYGTNILGYIQPPASPNPTGSQNASARCCQLTVSGSVPITFSKNGPLECTNPTNINAYSPAGSFAHDDNFDFVDTYSNYIFGDTGGVGALYACGTSYTSGHAYSYSGNVFTPGGSLSLNNRVACAAVYYSLAGAGKTEVVPACCSLTASTTTQTTPLTTQVTQWSTWTSTINGKPAAICPAGQFVIGINVNQGIGGGQSGVLCGTFDLSSLPSPTPSPSPTPTPTTTACPTKYTCQHNVTTTAAGTCSPGTLPGWWPGFPQIINPNEPGYSLNSNAFYYCPYLGGCSQGIIQGPTNANAAVSPQYCNSECPVGYAVSANPCHVITPDSCYYYTTQNGYVLSGKPPTCQTNPSSFCGSDAGFQPPQFANTGTVGTPTCSKTDTTNYTTSTGCNAGDAQLSTQTSCPTPSPSATPVPTPTPTPVPQTCQVSTTLTCQHNQTTATTYTCQHTVPGATLTATGSCLATYTSTPESALRCYVGMACYTSTWTTQTATSCNTQCPAGYSVSANPCTIQARSPDDGTGSTVCVSGAQCSNSGYGLLCTPTSPTCTGTTAGTSSTYTSTSGCNSGDTLIQSSPGIVQTSQYTTKTVCNPGDTIINTITSQTGCNGFCNGNQSYTGNGTCVNPDANGNGVCQYPAAQICPTTPSGTPSPTAPPYGIYPQSRWMDPATSYSGGQICQHDGKNCLFSSLWQQGNFVNNLGECTDSYVGNTASANTQNYWQVQSTENCQNGFKQGYSCANAVCGGNGTQNGFYPKARWFIATASSTPTPTPMATTVPGTSSGISLANLGSNPSQVVVDAQGQFAYLYSTYPSAGILTKIRLRNTDGTLNLSIEKSIGPQPAIYKNTFVVDPQGQYGYYSGLGAYINDGVSSIVKVRLSDMTILGKTDYPNLGDDFTSALIDPAGTYGYFGASWYPIVNGQIVDRGLAGNVAKIRLSDMTLIGSVAMAYDYDPLAVSVDAGSTGYFSSTYRNTLSSSNVQDQLCKININTMTNAQCINRPNIGSPAYLDSTNGFAYFGSSPINQFRTSDLGLNNQFTTSTGFTIDVNRQIMYAQPASPSLFASGGTLLPQYQLPSFSFLGNVSYSDGTVSVGATDPVGPYIYGIITSGSFPPTDSFVRASVPQSRSTASPSPSIGPAPGASAYTGAQMCAHEGKQCLFTKWTQAGTYLNTIGDCATAVDSQSAGANANNYWQSAGEACANGYNLGKSCVQALCTDGPSGDIYPKTRWFTADQSGNQLCGHENRTCAFVYGFQQGAFTNQIQGCDATLPANGGNNVGNYILPLSETCTNNFNQGKECFRAVCQNSTNPSPNPDFSPNPNSNTNFCQGNSIFTNTTTYAPVCLASGCGQPILTTVTTLNQTCPNGCNAGSTLGIGEPYSALRLDNTNLLIADGSNHRVIEIAPNNSIVWQYGTTGTYGNASNQLYVPFYAERIQNGNTLIADSENQRTIEVDANHNIIWQYGPLLPHVVGTGADPDRPTKSVRLNNGNTLIAYPNDHHVVEVNPAQQVIWKSIQAYGPFSAQRLSNGNTLIADGSVNGNVIEVNSNDQIVWQYGNSVPGLGFNQTNKPVDALRLSNGNTLITDAWNYRVIEVNPAGQILWKYDQYANKNTLPVRSVRIPSSGNTLITERYDFISSTSNSAMPRVIEVDPLGNVVNIWQNKTPTTVASCYSQCQPGVNQTCTLNGQSGNQTCLNDGTWGACTPIPSPSPTPTPGPSLCRTIPSLKKFGGSTTDLARLLADPLADLKHVNNFALESVGQFKLAYRSAVSVCGQDFDNQVAFGPGFFALNDSNLSSTLIRPAQPVAVILTYPPSIQHPVLLYASGFHSNAADILKNGQVCPSTKCQNVVFIKGQAIFDAASFSDFLVTDQSNATPTPCPTSCPSPTPNPSGTPPFGASRSSQMQARCPAQLVVEKNTTITVFLTPGGVPACDPAMQTQAIGNNTAQKVAPISCDPTNGQHAFLVNTTTSGPYLFTASSNGLTAQCQFNVVGRTPTPTPELPFWLALGAAIGAFGLANNLKKIKA